MAEKQCRDAGLPRRQSFRRSLQEHADAGVSNEYLEALEQKRKQLDESIHKYVAAKEREYKQFEKDLKSQHKLAAAESHEKDAVVKTRRASSESTPDIVATSPLLTGKQKSVVDTLLAAGLRREQIGQPVAVSVVEDGSPPLVEAKKAAGLTDHRTSTDRDKDFVGVFTPAFLPALANKGGDPDRTSSAPPLSSATEKIKAGDQDGVHRAHSDTAMDVKAKRPAELQLVQRTSSSGSSADGKLASAMKSPSQIPGVKRKRVSLAVGDTIVAPSDNVPAEMSNHSTPSHSRARMPVPERETVISTEAMGQPPVVKGQADAQIQPGTEPLISSISERLTPNGMQPGPSPIAQAAPSAVPTAPAPTTLTSKIDPDGDLFDLEDDDEEPSIANVTDDPFESDDEITGRIDLNGSSITDAIYDPDGGVVPEEGSVEHAEHVEFMPGSAVTPTNPGFRRPSATFDPIYRGANYERAEYNAAVKDVYGSSFNRPSSKGSFQAGSLGESFMAQNAERLMRNRTPQEQRS